MARFLLTVWPLVGHCHPAMALAEGLRAHGHEVAFYTGTRRRSMVEAEGYAYFPFRQVDERSIEALLLSPTRGLRCTRPRSFARDLRTWLLATIPQQVADLRRVCAEWRPDLVVSDATMWGPPLVLAERDGIPVAVCSTMIGSLLPGPDAPLWGLGIRPAHNWITRQRARLLLRLVDVLALGFRRSLDSLRAAYRLPPLGMSALEHLARMPLCLVRGAPELDYERCDAPPNLHYVGALTWNGSDRARPETWRAGLPPGKPLIHVTEGSMQTAQPTLLRAAALGLADLPVHVVMTTGTHRDPASLNLGRLPSNVSVHRWIPHGELLSCSRAVVTVGGAGTVLAALEAGVPLVVVPVESDQWDNAQRVVSAGAGVRLPRRRCHPASLRRAVAQVLEDPSYARHAQRLAADLAHYKGASRAAHLLEHFLTRVGGGDG